MIRFAPVAASFLALALPVGAAAQDTPPASPAPTPADLVLTGGKVKTPAGWAEALAVRDGIVVAVGTAEEVKPLVGEATRVLDLKGDTLLPGLHDMHVHALFAGTAHFACNFRQAAPAAEVAAAVKACAAGRPKGAWVTGGDWVAAAFQPGEQTKALLDAAAPDHPVLLNDEAHHSVWVNSKALELAGVTRDTPDPEGGIIERDTDGEPTGIFRETATRLVERVVPPASEEDRKRAIAHAAREMLSYGITSFLDASIRAQNVKVFSDLSRDGTIKQRIRGCIVWETRLASWRAGGYGAAEKLIAERQLYTQPRYKLDCVKMFMDGVPTESRTAAMVDPYLPAGGAPAPAAKEESPNRGMLLIRGEELLEAVARFDRQGLGIKFHAAGDGGVRAALDAVANARRANGWGGPRHHIAHSTFVHEADIPRARELNVAWEFSPYIWYPTPIASVDILKVVGPERMRRWVPIKDALATGALVVAGSDWPIVPSVNPWLAMETLVTREVPGGGPETLGGGQAIPFDEAFRIMTENAAVLMGHRDKVGTLQVGMRADMIVTDVDPFAAPIRQLHATKVKLTFIDGETVYDRAAEPGR